MTDAKEPERPTHIDPAAFAEIKRLNLLRLLALEQAASATARAEALDAQRALVVLKDFATRGVPVAATYDVETGAISYPPEPSPEVKAALADAKKGGGS